MDNLFRYISHDGSVVLNVLDSTEIVSTMERLHHTSATASAALGRLLTAASLMGYGLKDDNCSMTVVIKGDGPIGSLTVVSDWLGNVRGYCDNPLADLPENSKGKLDVGGVVGHNGYLYVVKDLGMDTPYIGQIELVTSEIAEDITAYYANSEQIPTACALGVLVDKDLTIKKSGGFLLQLLPGADEAYIDIIESNIAELESITSLMEAGKTPEDIAALVLKDLEPELLDSTETTFKCTCSRDRMEKVLISLGKKELYSLAEEQENTEIVCHFCNSVYNFTSEELIALANSNGIEEDNK